MRKIISILAVSLLLGSTSFAHEEPPKTLKEKQEKEEKRLAIRAAKISASTLWKIPVSDGVADSASAEKYLTTLYNSDGRPVKMMVFKENGILDYHVELVYDQLGNIFTDTDLGSDGIISQHIEYFYDAQGRVRSQNNYGREKMPDSNFKFEINDEVNELLFTKRSFDNRVEYYILYKYEKSVDYGNNTEIIKMSPTEELITRVENEYAPSGKRTIKRVFDENNKLMYYFCYEYDEQQRLSEILKKSPEDETLTITSYTYNDKGMEFIVELTDSAGILKLRNFHTYEYRK